MRPSAPTRNFARRRLLLLEPAEWRPAMNSGRVAVDSLRLVVAQTHRQRDLARSNSELVEPGTGLSQQGLEPSTFYMASRHTMARTRRNAAPERAFWASDTVPSGWVGRQVVDEGP